MAVYTVFGQSGGGTASGTTATRTVGMQFSLTEAAELTGIWFYSASGQAHLPTACDIWTVSTGTTLVRNASPTWSGAAGSGWVKCTFSGTPLEADTNYVVAFENGSGETCYSVTTDYAAFVTGGGIVSGIINVPDNGASAYGQCVYTGGTDAYPSVTTNGDNFWVDVEVTTPDWSVLQSQLGGNGAEGSNTCNVIPGATLSAGSKLMFYVSAASSGIAIDSIADGSGNQATQLAWSYFDDDSSGGGVGALWCMDTPTADAGTTPTFTVTFSGNINATAQVLLQEVTGLAAGTTAAADGSPGVIAGDTIPPGNTGATGYASTATGEYLVSLYGDWGNVSTIDQPSGWTVDPSSENTSGNQNVMVAYTSSTGGTEADSWDITNGSEEEWTVITVAFKLAGTPASPKPGLLLGVLQ